MWTTAVLPPLLIALTQAPLPPGASRELPPDHPQVMPEGHPPMPSSDELMKTLDALGPSLNDKPKTFEVSASLGMLYYTQGRLTQALLYLEQASAKAATFRALYAKLKAEVGTKPLPDPSAFGCAPQQDASLDARQKKVETELKGQPAKAAACAKASLGKLMAVEGMLANAKFLMGNADEALKLHERSLELFEDNLESRYARAALLLDTKGDDVAALGEAKKELERVLKEDPKFMHARQAQAFLKRVDEAIAAGGVSKVKPTISGPAPSRLAPQLAPEVIAAAQQVQRTPETEAFTNKLLDEAEEHLARGRYQQALDNYKQLMQLNAISGRAKAGMAWSLVKLGKPTAENVWRAASDEPAAIDVLGDTLKNKGDADGAKGVWARLSDTVPGYAPKVKEKLK